ncbi:putative ubiquinone biosynthesis monooxygenase [Ranunculus cassubicifolius]
MNRIIAKRGTVATVQTFKLLTRGLTSVVAAGVPGPTPHAPLNYENQEQLGSKDSINKHDIAIVGGGMVGLSLACALSSMSLTKKLKVAIIDSNPALGKKFSIKKDDLPDPRVSTVTPATISFFKDIGAWDYVLQHRHAYFDKMQVWDYTGLGYTRYTANDIDTDVLGCVVENKVLQSSLMSCLQNADFPKTIYPSRLTSMTIGPDTQTKGIDSESYGMAKLDMTDGNSLYAKLVVGADGGKSHVRELAGIKTTGWNYSQNAIICTVKHTMENNCAWQRFLPSGPIALLPIGDNYSNIVWTMNPNEASDRKSMNEDDFLKAVNQALDYGYGPHPQPGSLGYSGDNSWEVPPKVVELVTERMVFPLSLKHANDYAVHRVALIGDAAHTVHPLAGQGVNLGFGDASALSKIIADGIAVGSDLGEVSLLKKYEAERKSANIMMTALLDGCQKAYSVDFGPVNVLRAAAFQAAQYISPLKKSIISYATGQQKWPLFF